MDPTGWDLAVPYWNMILRGPAPDACNPGEDENAADLDDWVADLLQVPAPARPDETDDPLTWFWTHTEPEPVYYSSWYTAIDWANLLAYGNQIRYSVTRATSTDPDLPTGWREVAEIEFTQTGKPLYLWKVTPLTGHEPTSS